MAGIPEPLQQFPALPPTKTIVYEQFGWDIVDQPSLGRRDIIIIAPNGERVVLPFETAKAEEFGKRVAAPSLHMPNGKPHMD